MLLEERPSKAPGKEFGGLYYDAIRPQKSVMRSHGWIAFTLAQGRRTRCGLGFIAGCRAQLDFAHGTYDAW
ncbi:hypothetical protein EMIT0324P_120018 [Pseudomonas chlororaphis]